MEKKEKKHKPKGPKPARSIPEEEPAINPETPNEDQEPTQPKPKPKTTQQTETQTQTQQPQNPPKKRYVVFVGNLPYAATQPQITAHFATSHPTGVRLLTDRHDPRRRSRGVAFVEFARPEDLRTALLLHHSAFKCGGGAEEQRKINVELSAGGGGNTALRRERIRAKNEKLDKWRARRAEGARLFEQREREAKAGGGGDGEAGKKGGDGGGGGGGGEGDEEERGERSAMRNKKAGKGRRKMDAGRSGQRRRFRGSWN
ncbi:hypothetical protein F4861DRAFT_538452 [Xylaria intraflava]|nr:hypothetical protein F4861DRAFT_538452 [Xylaria intraflava]